jgi:hypothetical protein
LGGCFGDIPKYGNGGNGGSGGSGTGGGDAIGDGGTIAPQCGKQTFPVAVSKQQPNVMMVVDESGSMADPIAGTTTAKWDALKAAVKTLVTQDDATVNFGLSIFPAVGAADSCAPGKIDVAIAAHTGTQITGKLDPIAAASLQGATPTVETLMAVQAQGGLTDTQHDNYVMLITDGVPTCAAESGVQPIIAALYARTPSVRTFVVGVGDVNSSNPTLLNAWADAGHTARMGPTHYYDANDVNALAMSFQTIIGTVASCTYALGSKPDDPSLVTAYLDGKPVPQDPKNGVSYDAASNSLVFHGTSCDQIKAGGATKVEVVYGCPSPTIG